MYCELSMVKLVVLLLFLTLQVSTDEEESCLPPGARNNYERAENVTLLKQETDAFVSRHRNRSHNNSTIEEFSDLYLGVDTSNFTLTRFERLDSGPHKFGEYVKLKKPEDCGGLIGSNKDDLLWNLVKNNEFLTFDHSLEQIKPSRFDFPTVTKQSDDGTTFSSFGVKVIKEYLHIGLVNENTINGRVKRSRILLLLWPQFVSPSSYQSYKLYLADLKKIKTLVFRVPGDVFQKYSEGNNSLNEIVAAAAILTQVEEWNLLERAVITSFYHLIFDEATSDLHGDLLVWQDYPKNKLNKEWKQLFFICCGPQGLAYLVKRMLKRNWARIARDSLSSDIETDEYSVFSTVAVFTTLIEWAKLFFKQNGVTMFLEEINAIKPVLSTSEIADKLNDSFTQCMSSSKKHGCNICPYQTDNTGHLVVHMRSHSGEAPYVCDVCGSAHKQAYALKNHIIIYHTGDYPYHCKYCGKPFVVRAAMMFHHTVHERKGNVHFKCYKCSHVAKNEARLLEHVPTDLKDPTFNCTVCIKKHDSESALVAHMRNHSKDKPFNCHVCKRGFLFEHSLLGHYVTHSDSRQVFTCRFCNKNLATNRSLRTHIAAQHSEELHA